MPKSRNFKFQRALKTLGVESGARQARRVIARGAWWQISAASDDVAELLIYGDIGESFWGESVTARELVQQLTAINAKTINVRINSDGGSVNDGIAIYNSLRKHGARIEVDIDGAAFSIASMIAMAGDTVRMPDNALLMVHAPHGFASGNAVELREFAGVLDMYAQAMQHAYVNKVGQAKAAEIKNLLDDGENHFFTAQEAADFGFVDEITPALAIAASFDRARYPNLPAVAAAFQRNEDQPMNWKAIAKALGLSETASVDETKAKLRELGLDDGNVTVEQITAALAQQRSSSLSPAETVEQVQARITLRNKEICAVFAKFRSRPGVADLERDVLADASISVEAARNKLLTHLGNAAEPLNPGVPTIEAGVTDGEKRNKAMVAAALMRAGITKDPDTGEVYAQDRANPYRGLTLREQAREYVRASGRNVSGLSGLDIARLALVRASGGGQSTSDFPVFLENVLNKAVMSGFQAITPSYPRFCKIGTVQDFRPNRRILPGMIANLDKVNEGGEYKNKNLPDGEKESIQAVRRGNIVEITPETIVNDDLAAIVDMARGLGMAGPRTIDRVVFALLAQNSNLGPTLTKDNKTLIHADHGNTGTGAPSVTALSALYQKMARQKFPGDDQEIMDLVPRVAVANTIVAGDIRVVNDSQYDPASNNQKPNKVRGTLTDIVGTERMPATIYYLFADPNIAPVIEVVFLDGVQAVRVVQEENFRTAGLAWRGELNADAGAVDYRGIVYSTGV